MCFGASYNLNINVNGSPVFMGGYSSPWGCCGHFRPIRPFICNNMNFGKSFMLGLGFGFGTQVGMAFGRSACGWFC